MQFTEVFAILAAAAVASAAATPSWSGSSSSSNTNKGNICPEGQQQVCCQGGGIIGGSCELNILGQNCQAIAGCCNIHQDGSLVLFGGCGPLINL